MCALLLSLLLRWQMVFMCCRWLFCALFFVQDICQRIRKEDIPAAAPYAPGDGRILRHIKRSFVGRKRRDSCRQGYQRADESLTREQALTKTSRSTNERFILQLLISNHAAE